MDVSGKLVVIDASVVLAWMAPDELVVEENNELLIKSMTGEVEFAAPVLLRFEVWNALKSMQLSKRISRTDAIMLLQKFSELRIQYFEMVELGQQIMKLALEKNLSVYDASYVVLAKELKCELKTLDNGLLGKL